MPILLSINDKKRGFYMSDKERTKKEAEADVKTSLEMIHGQLKVVKRYPEGGKRKKQQMRCKG